MVVQRTISNQIQARGIGLHTGKNIDITLYPAPDNTGILFRRIDLDEPVDIPALAKNVVDTNLSTAIGKSGVSISTVEHLLSAIAGLGIDNLIIEVNGPEVPIMDGSASPFVFLLQSAGVCYQTKSKEFFVITKEVEIIDGDKYAKFLPYHGFKVSCSIDFDHPVFKRDHLSSSIDFSTTSFVREISRARTFGFVRDVEVLQKEGRALGGSLNNCLVIDDYNILNEDGLRYNDEFVKHKVVDAIGDLYLLGKSVIGHFVAHKSGHALNNRLLLEILSREDCWKVTTFDDADQSPISYLAKPQLGI